MNYILIAIAAAILSAGTALTDKYLLERIPLRSILAVIGVFGILSLALLPLTGTAMPSPAQWLEGAGIGLLLAGVIYTAFRGIRLGEVSRLAPLAVLATVFITVGGVLFFENTLTKYQILGIAFLSIGSLLLATKFERRVRIFEIEHWSAMVKNPIQTSKEYVLSSAQDLKNILQQLTIEELVRAKVKTRVRLVKGFWWYLASIALLVPYTLLAAELFASAGSIGGFVVIRMGMAVGCLCIVCTNLRELRVFVRKPRLVAIASVKEVFGVTGGFLTLLAFSLGPLGVVRGLLSIDSALIFLAGIVLSSWGILDEAINRATILQKATGVIAMLIGTLLLVLK